jgi:uncharacterized protein
MPEFAERRPPPSFRGKRRSGVPALMAWVACGIALGMVAMVSTTGFLSHRGGGAGTALDDLPVPPTAGSVPGSADPQAVTSAPGVVATAQPDSKPEPSTVAPTTTMFVDNTPVPTAEDPARLYIAGDSDAGALGPPLQRAMQATGVVTSKLLAKPSTGLTRPDFFDWPSRLKRDISKFHPDLVVVTFGGNDAQDIIINHVDYPVDTPEWATEYGRRVGVVMDYLRSEGRTLFWVGIPNAASAAFTARLKVLRDVTMAEAARRPDVVYIDTWKRFSGRNDIYLDYVVDPATKVLVDARKSDGFHLSDAGVAIQLADIVKVVKKELQARGAQL